MCGNQQITSIGSTCAATRGARRLLFWVMGGALLAIVLLVSSICTYVAVSQGLIEDHFNASAALAPLISLGIIALRLRSYLAGRKLEQEIEIARSVQRDLLPPPQCELDEFEIAGDYVPVAGVSGDFYDAFPVSGRVAFIVGDVAGKGIPAALLMGVLHGAVRASVWTPSRRDHEDATRQINQLLCERTSTARFTTMFWAYFDSQAKHLKYINAGHCPPILLKAGRRGRVLRLFSGGPVLGLRSNAGFEQGSVRLDPGDRLILYSDGIVEAVNAAGEEFGEGRLVAALREDREDTADGLRDHILTALSLFTGGAVPQDDRTLVVAVYRSAPPVRAGCLGSAREEEDLHAGAYPEVDACVAA
jgi:serine phosphatase RsbU (regulator of sigma subunit)